MQVNLAGHANQVSWYANHLVDAPGSPESRRPRRSMRCSTTAARSRPEVALGAASSQAISSWISPQGKPALNLLSNDAPDLAVARGAATYALVRRGLGLRIGGGSPRSYYLAVGEGDQAVCAIPRGAAEGRRAGDPQSHLHAGARAAGALSLAGGERLSAGAAGRSDLARRRRQRRCNRRAARAASHTSGGAGRGARRRNAAGEPDRDRHAGDLLRRLAGSTLAARVPASRASPIGGRRSGQRQVALPKTIEPARGGAPQIVFWKRSRRPLQGREVKDLWRNLEKSARRARALEPLGGQPADL